MFAAAAAPHRLEARSGKVVLDGVKPWYSLAGQLDAALTTAHAGGGRQLFRVRLPHPSVTVEPLARRGSWPAATFVARSAGGEDLGLRVRAVEADAAERTLRQVGHALGPAPLAFEEEHCAAGG